MTMDISAAIETIEYKIATESDNFTSGRAIRLDITDAWPPLSDLLEALGRRFPHTNFTYDHQANNRIQLVIQHRQF